MSNSISDPNYYGKLRKLFIKEEYVVLKDFTEVELVNAIFNGRASLRWNHLFPWDVYQADSPTHKEYVEVHLTDVLLRIKDHLPKDFTVNGRKVIFYV